MADPAFDIITASTGLNPVRAGDTLTFQYAPARGPASYVGQWPALMNVRTAQANYTQDTDFAITYGPASIVVTYNGTAPIAANVVVSLQLPLRDTSGQPTVYGTALPDSITNPGI